MNASRNNALRKPDAGNPHVRFDEGEGSQRSLPCAFNPWLPSLLYRQSFLRYLPGVNPRDAAFDSREDLPGNCIGIGGQLCGGDFVGALPADEDRLISR